MTVTFNGTACGCWNSLFGSTGGQSVDTCNSVFAPNAAGAAVDVHSTEVDPIAEAEVYIAYSREAQAEEILKEALKKQPERQASEQAADRAVLRWHGRGRPSPHPQSG